MAVEAADRRIAEEKLANAKKLRDQIDARNAAKTAQPPATDARDADGADAPAPAPAATEPTKS